MSKSYADLLHDPRWQRKRLQVLDRDGWKCTECGEHESELQVHHRYYAKDRKPWEYEGTALVTLCDPCHERAEQLRLLLVRSAGPLDFEKTMRVVGYAEGLVASASIAVDVKIAFRGPFHLFGFCEAMGTDPEVALGCFSADGTASLRALQGAKKRSAA